MTEQYLMKKMGEFIDIEEQIQAKKKAAERKEDFEEQEFLFDPEKDK